MKDILLVTARPVHELSNREIVDEARRFAEQLERANVAPDAARKMAHLRYPAAAAAESVIETKRANVLEKEEQRVYWLSQAERSGQTPGLGDLWLAHPARRLATWWETKRQLGGTRSRVQQDFAAECISCEVGYGFGDRYDFHRWLTARGFTAPPIPQD
jgi:hypothetical protein